MTTRHLIAGALSALFLAAAAPTLAVEPHAHDGAAPAHKITLDHGRKWATDAPLREGMTEIRKALARQHAAVKKGTMSDAGYAELGAAIEKNVASIVANCKLSPEADANLHVIVAELVGAADELKAGAAASHEAAARKAMNAVNLYGRYFDHPGWKPLA
jgi:hypothetical protein